MIRSIIMFCAEGVVRDAESNNISVFNLLEEFSSLGFPLFVQKFYVFNLLEREVEDPRQVDCQYVVRSNDIQLISFPARIDFQQSMRNRSVGTIMGLTIPNPGVLTFEMKMGDSVLDSYTIKINPIRPQGTVEDSTPRA